MPLRPPAGFISAFYDPLKNPNAPTIGTATGGDASASVTFTAPTNVGGSAISSYSALSTPGGFVGTAASSPISVTGLTNGTDYTFRVWATNTYGPSAYSAASNSATAGLTLGIFAGGSGTGNNSSYINISTLGNGTDWAATLVGYGGAGCGSTTRGIFAGGDATNVITYTTFSTVGSTTDFGDLLTTKSRYMAACNSATRGVFAGGDTPGQNIIQYITIATTGNSTDFGDLSAIRQRAAGCSSPTRGIIAGGETGASTKLSVIQYVTIATTGNATDFGNLTQTAANASAASNSTRGIIAGGDPITNVIQYITIATTGNATDFGDLTLAVYGSAAVSSYTRVVVGGGGEPATNVMSYVTISTTGNSTDFGDLSMARYYVSSASSSNGGVQ